MMNNVSEKAQFCKAKLNSQCVGNPQTKNITCTRDKIKQHK